MTKANTKLPPPFTCISATQNWCLYNADVSGNGFACYNVITRNHADGTALCYRHVEQALEELQGMTKQQWSNHIKRLCSKTFTAPDGKQYPVLVKVKPAHRGQCATYHDNPYALAMGYELLPAPEKGTRIQVPKRYTPTCTNQQEKGTRPDTERYTPRAEKVHADVYPEEEEKEEEDIQAVGGALRAPQAKRSAATPQVVSNNQQQIPRRLQHGIPANATPPTYEEWVSIHEKLIQGKELTDEEKRTYSAGYHEYISIYRQQGLAS